MTELCGIKFDGFIEIERGIYYKIDDGSCWSNKKTEIIRNELGQSIGSIPINVNELHPITNKRDNYSILEINGITKQYHRLVWEHFNCEIPKGMVVDHIDNNRQNNRICNLQLLSKKDNGRKRLIQSNNISCMPGVCFSNAHKKYLVKLTINKIRTHIGYFTDPLEAFKAFLQSKIKYHGPESITPIRDSIVQHLGQDYYDSLLRPGK